jgi:nucleoside-diphosphate-sugar epimerase
MKVFVAGATGVLGRRAVARLLDAGHEVTAVVRTVEATDRIRAAGARPVTVDLFDPPRVAAAVGGHDAVVNLATHIPATMHAWRRGAWRENDRLRREAATNLVAGAADAVVVVQESIAFLYDDHGTDRITESDRVRPGPVTGSALAAEAAAHAATADGRRGVVLRFGQFVAPDAGHTRYVLAMARRGRLALLGPPAGHVSFVDADDAAAAVVAALDAPAGTYNVCEDEPATRAEHAAALAAVAGRPVRPLPRWLGRTRLAEPLARSHRLSNARLRAVTDWRPRVPEIRADWERVAGNAGDEPKEAQHA